MARIEKTRSKEDAFQFDIELEDEVTVAFKLDGEVDGWIQDIHKQLLIWRNIPAPSQINIHDISVNTLCHKYKVDSKRGTYYGKVKRSAKFAQDTIRSVTTFVQGQAIEVRSGLVNQLVSLKFLKNAFVLDKIAGLYVFRPDIKGLFTEEEIEAALEKYFAPPIIEHRPEFPTFDRNVAIEHVFPLMDLLLKTFDVEWQLELAIKEHDIDLDARLEEVEATHDDAGFLASGLDTVLDD